MDRWIDFFLSPLLHAFPRHLPLFFIFFGLVWSGFFLSRFLSLYLFSLFFPLDLDTCPLKILSPEGGGEGEKKKGEVEGVCKKGKGGGSKRGC